MTARPYDGPLSALRAVWEHRHEPDAHARRCAGDAVDAIDNALRSMHAIGGW